MELSCSTRNDILLLFTCTLVSYFLTVTIPDESNTVLTIKYIIGRECLKLV